MFADGISFSLPPHFEPGNANPCWADAKHCIPSFLILGVYQSGVRDLYKRILVVGRDYPAGLEHVRERAKAEFGKRAALTDDVQIKRAIAYGRYMVKEMIGVVQLKKYRTMKKRYVPDD